MSAQHWDFPAIEAGASDILGAVSQTHGLLDEGKSSLMKLQSAWQGDGASAYAGVQTRWDSTANELNSSLQNLAHAISEAAQTMAQTEAGVTSNFA